MKATQNKTSKTRRVTKTKPAKPTPKSKPIYITPEHLASKLRHFISALDEFHEIVTLDFAKLQAQLNHELNLLKAQLFQTSFRSEALIRHLISTPSVDLDAFNYDTFLRITNEYAKLHNKLVQLRTLPSLQAILKETWKYNNAHPRPELIIWFEDLGVLASILESGTLSQAVLDQIVDNVPLTKSSREKLAGLIK